MNYINYRHLESLKLYTIYPQLTPRYQGEEILNINLGADYMKRVDPVLARFQPGSSSLFI